MWKVGVDLYSIIDQYDRWHIITVDFGELLVSIIIDKLDEVNCNKLYKRGKWQSGQNVHLTHHETCVQSLVRLGFLKKFLPCLLGQATFISQPGTNFRPAQPGTNFRPDLPGTNFRPRFLTWGLLTTRGPRDRLRGSARAWRNVLSFYI